MVPQPRELVIQLAEHCGASAEFVRLISRSTSTIVKYDDERPKISAIRRCAIAISDQGRNVLIVKVELHRDRLNAVPAVER